jgi:uncharacterized protein (TIRG00374 family)
LAQRGQLNLILFLLVLIVVVVAIAQYAVLQFAAVAPARFERVVVRAVTGLNEFSQGLAQRDMLPAERVGVLLAEASEGLVAWRQGGWMVHVVSFLLALVAKLAQTVLFALVLVAFGQPAGWEVVITGVSLAAVFTIVSPTPLGIGVTEGALALVLTQFGQTFETALVVSLAHRAVSVWWPFVYGFAAFQFTGLRMLRKPST